MDGWLNRSEFIKLAAKNFLIEVMQTMIEADGMAWALEAM